MAQNQSAVTILDVSQVSPPPNLTDSTTKSLPLTFFDILWLRFPPVQRLFFYQITAPNTTQLLFDSIIPKLKHSLSLTLQHYLPLAGNLVWPQDSHKPIIKYVDGDGVSLTIAESNMDFYHLSSNEFRQATECHPLIPRLAVSHERAAVIAVQITVFPNSGFSIGITSHHAVLDGKTSTSFMKSWAHISKATGAESSPPSLVPELTPFYDRTVIKNVDELEAIFTNEWLKQGGPNNRSLMLMEFPVPPDSVRGTFELSQDDLKKLRESVIANNSSKSPLLHLSTFSLSCGYTWACLAKSSEIVRGKKAAAIGLSIDCRSRLEPAIPATYFGNCVGGRMVEVAEAEDLVGEDGGLFSALEAISQALRSLDNGVLNGAETWASFINSDVTEIPIGIAGSPRFEVYSSDFGWGRPTKVEMTSIERTGAVCLSDGKNGNGSIEIGLVLNMEKMEAFASAFAKGLG